MGKMIDLTASDGHKLAAYRAEPSGKPRGKYLRQQILNRHVHIRERERHRILLRINSRERSAWKRRRLWRNWGAKSGSASSISAVFFRRKCG